MEIPWDTAKSSLIISNRMRKHFIVQNLNFRKKKMPPQKVLLLVWLSRY